MLFVERIRHHKVVCRAVFQSRLWGKQGVLDPLTGNYGLDLAPLLAYSPLPFAVATNGIPLGPIRHEIAPILPLLDECRLCERRPHFAGGSLNRQATRVLGPPNPLWMVSGVVV